MPGSKHATTSIRVDADLPAGKALVLLGPLYGVQLVTVGVPLDFRYRWRNVDPPLELYLIAASDLPALAEFKRWNNDQEIYDLLRRGFACGSPFMAETTIPSASAAIALRYEYKLHTTDGACRAEFVSLDHLDADEKVITRDTTPPSPPLTIFDLQDTPQHPRVWNRLPGTAKDRADAAAAGCGSCDASAPGGPGLALLALTMLVRRRRARSAAAA